MEIWKAITGYEGLYEISSLGRVKSLKRTKINRNKIIPVKERIMKNVDRGKYFAVTLSKSTNKKMYLIHRLVAQNFISNPENKAQVNHIDGDKYNNNVENLEWVTPSENINHAYKTGLKRIFKRNEHWNSKLTQKQVDYIVYLLGLKAKQSVLADIFNVTQPLISKIKKDAENEFGGLNETI